MKSTDIASQRLPHMVFAFVSKLMALLAVSGCASIGMPAVAEPVQYADSPRIKQMTQVIIKFRDPALDPSRQDYLRVLAHDTGVKLVYVRPMSGGAHVLRVEGAVDAEQFQRVVNGLATRPEVEYAEPDRLLHHMPQR
jgi:hypothetical protein